MTGAYNSVIVSPSEGKGPIKRGVLRITRNGVMAKIQNYNPEVKEFKPKLRFYAHFRTYTLGKGMDTSIPWVMD